MDRVSKAWFLQMQNNIQSEGDTAKRYTAFAIRTTLQLHRDQHRSQIRGQTRPSPKHLLPLRAGLPALHAFEHLLHLSAPLSDKQTSPARYPAFPPLSSAERCCAKPPVRHY